MPAEPIEERDALDRLVAAVAAFAAGGLPAAVEQRAARVLADTVGAVLGGAATAEVRALAAGAPPGTAAQMLVPGLPWTTTEEAALVDGTAAVVLELDECAPGNGGHAAAHVVPAALAVAQAGRLPGRALLAAVVAGYEVAARLGQAHAWAPPVHGHGHVGTVGGAVAVALLRGADPVAAARVAANLPLLTAARACHDGATVRHAWTGVSASLALLAARLADAGFTGSGPARSAALGAVLGREVAPEVLDAPVDGPGLQIMANSTKFHGACFETHAALEAALAHGAVTPDTVADVLVEMPVPQLPDLPNGTPLSNRFSVPYGVAAALVHGHTGPAAFAADPAVFALARRVHVVAGDVPRATADSEPARLTVTTRDGGRRSHTVALPRGHHPDRPDDAALRAKFRSLAPVPDPDALFARLLGVAAVDDVAVLLP